MYKLRTEDNGLLTFESLAFNRRPMLLSVADCRLCINIQIENQKPQQNKEKTKNTSLKNKHLLNAIVEGVRVLYFINFHINFEILHFSYFRMRSIWDYDSESALRQSVGEQSKLIINYRNYHACSFSSHLPFYLWVDSISPKLTIKTSIRLCSDCQENHENCRQTKIDTKTVTVNTITELIKKRGTQIPHAPGN